MVKNNLSEILLKHNLLTEGQLEEVIQKQKVTEQEIDEILVNLGYVKEEELLEVLESQLGIPTVYLKKRDLTPQLAKYVPENLARRHKLVPLEKEKERLKVAMVDPGNLLAIEDIEIFSGLKVEPLLTSNIQLKYGLHQIYSKVNKETSEIFASLEEYQEEDNNEVAVEDIKNMVDDAPIVKLANLIIGQALEKRASDIHIEPQIKQIRIRFRVDGVLREEMTVPKTVQAALISRFKIIAGLDITEKRVPQDGRLEVNFAEKKTDMRLSTLPTVFGEKIVIRILNKDEKLLNLNNLGFTKKNLDRFHSLISKSHGVILVTGPTGSGKSTTLFAALNKLNSVDKNIVTIEDPVEFQLDGINQVHAQHKIGLTFAKTLRSILRQDPDIIMIGEIRDKETAKIAIQAALTGHLVLSTLHTNDAVSSITRLLDMGIPPYLVASSVIGIIAQRLIRRICKNCSHEYKPTVVEKKFFAKQLKKLYRGRGCKKCGNTGYQGRIAIHEILIVDTKIRKMVVQKVDEDYIKDYAIKKGMLTLKDDGKIKAIKSLTTYEELARIIA